MGKLIEEEETIGGPVETPRNLMTEQRIKPWDPINRPSLFKSLTAGAVDAVADYTATLIRPQTGSSYYTFSPLMEAEGEGFVRLHIRANTVLAIKVDSEIITMDLEMCEAVPGQPATNWYIHKLELAGTSSPSVGA